LKEKAFELLKKLINDHFKKLLEVNKTPTKNSTVDRILDSIVSNYHESKYISKRAESVFDALIN
jgi:hypothetical protein